MSQKKESVRREEGKRKRQGEQEGKGKLRDGELNILMLNLSNFNGGGSNCEQF